jgi:hypothetical protein
MNQQSKTASGGNEKKKGTQTRQPEGQHEKVISPASPGDDRTPEKIIGEVKYAGGQDKRSQDQGGAGEPETTLLEPEKQGGIGGP